MATTPQQFISGGLPTNTIWAQNTTLYRIAADNLGNAMYWNSIAAINGLVDPWVRNLTLIKIPVIFDTTDISGIFLPPNPTGLPIQPNINVLPSHP